jgi:DNA topoisomerase III
MQLVLAEKPSVARDLARVLGVRPSGRGAFEGGKVVITWCVGHLVELDEPASYDPRWKAWRLDTLPMLPDRFRLRPVPSSEDQLREVKRLLADRRFTEVVNACDAGREGELIFRYVYELAGCRLPVRRLWISSMTDEAIRQGFAALRPGSEYDRLGDAARSRSEADWLVGLNATRAVTVRHRTGGDSPLYSIGRVQTPTLALVVARDEAIRKFVPTRYWEVRGTFGTTTGEKFDALWTHQGEPREGAGKRVTRLGAEGLAQELITRLGGEVLAPVVESLRARRTREPPPLLFDLTSLQRTANRRYGLAAARTLEIAQALYETHKILTYPRTDSRYLSRDLAPTLPTLFSALEAVPELSRFAQHLAKEISEGGAAVRFATNRRIFDDGKVQDHHAIIPTGKRIDLSALGRDEARIFDLVARRFLAAFYPDAEFAATDAVVRVGALPPGTARVDAGEPAADKNTSEPSKDEPILPALPPPPDRFFARGRVRVAAGWQEVAGLSAEAAGGKGEGGDKGDEAVLPALREGDRLGGSYTPLAKETRPPPHLTEGTLLAAMETAGRTIEDEELRAAMKESGLGTPATRAATIETLIKRGFIVRAGKNLEATRTGTALIAALPVPSLSSPELTGRWEARLARIARGLEERPAFMADIGRYVAEVVDAIRKAPVNAVMAAAPGGRPTAPVARPTATGPRAPGAIPRAAEVTPTAPAPTPPRKRTKSDKPRAPKSREATRANKAGAPGDGKPAGGTAEAPLICPRCRQGTLLTGKRGWGCSRWREGCGFVVWFDLEGKRLSEAQLRELVGKGKTRKTTWPQAGAAVPGRLVLDVAAPAGQGAVRFEPQ